ncbi:MAG: hypothetical protein JSS02_34945, partial [Planctomycetes bacterium]|nr:hypothetical protein [Planctomycetota bacterium]
AIGPGSDRWFSGGSGLSVGQASTILDYLVLVELLLQYRQDLANYQQDLHDCRDQLRMQLRRYTEDKPRHNVPLVDRLVAELARRIGVA